jgi:hypothetical protein
MGQIKKQVLIVILGDKLLLIIMIISHYFYDLIHLEAMAKLQKCFCSVLVQMKTLKFASEIN